MVAACEERSRTKVTEVLDAARATGMFSGVYSMVSLMRGRCMGEGYQLATAGPAFSIGMAHGKQPSMPLQAALDYYRAVVQPEAVEATAWASYDSARAKIEAGRLDLGENCRLTECGWLLWAVNKKGVDWGLLKALVPEAALQAALQAGQQAGQPQGQAQQLEQQAQLQLEQAGQPQGQGPEPWMTVESLRRMIGSIVKQNIRKVARSPARQQEGQQQPQQGDGAKQTQRVTRSSARQQEGQQQQKDKQQQQQKEKQQK